MAWHARVEDVQRARVDPSSLAVAPGVHAGDPGKQLRSERAPRTCQVCLTTLVLASVCLLCMYLATFVLCIETMVVRK